VRGDEVYVQQASLPQRKVSPKRSLVVLLAILLSGFALLMFVFARKAIASAAQDPETSRKLDVILVALGLRTIV
jgi:flagellar basal body-associated protein FliL